MTKSIFQFQCCSLISHPEEIFKALIDPRLVGLFKRVLNGKHDCYICRATLDLDPGADSSPGLVGFMHGDFPKEVDAVALAACCGCVRKLGDELAARTITRMFADECCGGGEVRLVEGGVA